MKTLITLLLLSLVLTSCGGKSKEKSTAATLVFSGNAMLTGEDMKGGVVIIGKQIGGPQEFSIGIGDISSSASLVLNEGTWKFLAIAWKGDSNAAAGEEEYTGIPRCAFVDGVQISGLNANINFNMSEDHCDMTLPDGKYLSTAAFIETASDTAGTFNTFQKLAVASCIDINSALVGGLSGSTCSSAVSPGGLGLANSYRFKVNGQMKGESPKNLPDYLSACFAKNTISLVRPPVGMTNGESIIPLEIIAYEGSNCDGDSIPYLLHEGAFAANTTNGLPFASGDISNVSSLYLEYNHETKASLTTFNNFFGNASLGSLSISSSAVGIATNQYAKISIIDGLGTQLSTTSSLNAFPGDEIIWYVTEHSGTTGCGTDFKMGMYNEGVIKSISGNSIELFKSMKSYRNLDNSTDILTLPSPTALASGYIGADYCSIQIHKIQQYDNITFDNSGSNVEYIAPPQYTPFNGSTNGIGGLMYIKARNVHVNDVPSSFGHFNVNQKSNLSLSGTSHDHNSCPVNRRCLFFGDKSATNAGSGAMIVNIENLITDASMVTSFSTEGIGSGSGRGANAGSMIVNIKSMDISAGSMTLQLLANGGSGTGGTGGDGGISILNYCTINTIPAVNLSVNENHLKGAGTPDNGVNGTHSINSNKCIFD